MTIADKSGIKPGPSEATPSTAGSVREALERLLAYVDDLKAAMLTLGQPAVDPDGDVAFAKEALAALSAPVEAPVAVKPLEWEEGSEPFHPEIWTAETIFGEVYVCSCHDNPAAYSWGSDEFSALNSDTTFATADAAKAAAQRDYETRILSALEA